MNAAVGPDAPRRRPAWRRGILDFLPAVPALVLVGVLLVIPVTLLVFRSFFGESGDFSLENYYRLSERLYIETLIVTFVVAAVVTAICALMAYPVAYLLSHVEARTSNILLIFVILPYWTSVLVRTYAWTAILQRRGLINTWLLEIGLISEPLPLLNNLFATIVGMVHIMLPLVILPLYANMRSIDPQLVKAAATCGATPWQSFRDVYFPKTLPGLFSGMVLIFVLALGYYVIPSLLGGGRVLMWAMLIESTMSHSPTLGPASALSVVLLVVTFAVLGMLGRWLRME